MCTNVYAYVIDAGWLQLGGCNSKVPTYIRGPMPSQIRSQAARLFGHAIVTGQTAQLTLMQVSAASITLIR